MQVMLQEITTQDNARIVMIQIAAGGMLNLTIVDILIVLHVMLEMLRATIIRCSVQIAIARIAGRGQYLIIMIIPIAYPAI
jgi:hypothetical protein